MLKLCAGRLASTALVFLAGLGIVGQANANPEPREAWLKRLQYVYTQEDMLGLQNSGPAAYVSQRLDLAAAELKQRQSTEVSKATFEYVAAVADRRREARSATGPEVNQLKSENLKFQNAIADKAITDSLEFMINEPSGVAGRLLWFWTNHFSVFFKKAEVRIYIADYERNAIGPRIFGSFDQLLIHAVLHPAMLVYLDNTKNSLEKGNENLAREILELHTLGVGNGYTQADVQMLALALTGIEPAQYDSSGEIINCRLPKCQPVLDTGAVIRLAAHDRTPKTFLGKTYVAGDGLEVLQMLTDLANRPETHRYIAQKLSGYFAGDQPLSAAQNNTVDALAASGGNLKAAYLALLAHENLLSRQSFYFTDPASYFISVARVAKLAQVEMSALDVRTHMAAAGMPHYGRLTPDGHPLKSSSWDTANALDSRRKVVANLVHRQKMNGEIQVQLISSLNNYLNSTLKSKSRSLLATEIRQPGRWLSLYFLTPEFVLN